MADHIYKKIELVGSSPKGIEEAVRNALARAKRTMRNMRWFEIAETRGYLEDGAVAHWQVTLKPRRCATLQHQRSSSWAASYSFAAP